MNPHFAKLAQREVRRDGCNPNGNPYAPGAHVSTPMELILDVGCLEDPPG